MRPARLVSTANRLLRSFVCCIVLFCTSASRVSAQGIDGTVDNAGLEVHYTIEGKGGPVVFLSGGPGIDVGYMKPLADLLAGEHTVILLEQRGTGRSRPGKIDTESVSEDLMLSDLEALRKHLGYKSWTVLGHSFGTYTAILYALRFPEATRDLVLLSTAMPPLNFQSYNDNFASRTSPDARRRLAEIAELEKVAPPQGKAALETEEAELNALPYFFNPAKVKPLILLSTPESFHKDTNALLFSPYLKSDFADHVKDLRLPVLIVVGRQDPSDPELASKTSTRMPDARLVVLERCGHFAWLEQPEKLQKLLHDFLAQRDGPS